MAFAATFSDFVVGIHVLAVVVAFGVAFAYPLIGIVGERIDKPSMAWYHQIQAMLGKRLISPALVVVLAAGIYLASDLHQWSKFYVQWGIGAVLVLGGVGGAYMAPREEQAAELAARDVAAAGDGDVRWSEEYLTVRGQIDRVGLGLGLLVAVTVFLMAVHAGA